jgi:pyridoxal phosphate enzyme (YggS family)
MSAHDAPREDSLRRDEIRAALAQVHARIDEARAAAGRTDPVRLVVVTKTFPASDVDLLGELGITDVGENRDQEAAAKRRDCTAGAEGLRWHMIGQLQRNKARSVVAWADVVESVDRAALVTALGTAAHEVGRRIDVLIQVNLDPEPTPGRGGALPQEVPELADLIAGQQALHLAGLMGVAPHPDGLPADSARAAFDRLAALAARVRQTHPEAHVISAGMSGDLEEAVAAGATQVRIGGAVLGTRPRVE